MVIGKWLARDSKSLCLIRPTRGMMGSKVNLQIMKSKQQSIGVVFVSSELPEILGISDRILVMADGRITKELKVEEATQDLILHYATQFEKKLDPVEQIEVG